MNPDSRLHTAILFLSLTICACVRLNLTPPPVSRQSLSTTIPWSPTPTPLPSSPPIVPARLLPALCHIKRNSCAYHRLVGIIDPTIVFKQEEAFPYETEDILMHPALLGPLSRLNRLVQAEWAGAYQLRVTDAYDSLLEHDPPESEPSRRYSLHYEGRAIDLTLWPVDYDRYGRLCALAHCAGFDWVHNEGTHCHASINAESLCFQCDE